ncbi:uncharacterized protein LOC105380138 isoform X3 [Plutella xylostella]|uniref:uncharacterized protein LOC105380138 isoform X3 n=1 Tax=Plutella xylostella TaxID=51655 RepID=UPI0020323873|nr:uncharacterized protein LOC105380138 isoform X3 [Plutella xylostella]
MAEQDKMKRLKKNKASMKSKLTQFETFLTLASSYGALSDQHYSELQLRLSKIENLYQDFDQLQGELEELCDPPEEQYADRQLFEDQYYRLVSTARQLVTSHDASINHGQSGSATSSNPDLTKEAYRAALLRFFSRRGKCRSITSDNATTFVGACNELHKLVTESSIGTELADEGIKFIFTPPYSPHMNGIAEAAVRSTKYHLKRILNLTHFTYEEMSTCLTQIEAILNSRPITPISTDPQDFCALTPAHFLIGRTLTSIPCQQIAETTNLSLLQRHKRVELIKQHFWTRFTNDYISTLQQKTKWHSGSNDLKENSLVLIKDKMSPPLLWSLGRILKVYPGVDGINRVAEIKTKKGTIRRGWNNICLLPLEDNL